MNHQIESNKPDLYGDGTGSVIQSSIKAAQEHDAIVQTYGRYPHRNQVLRRISTNEELKYLETADRWGQ